MSRVTVLTDDVIMASEHIGAPDDGAENYMVREILEPDMDEWKAAYAQNWPAPPEDTSDVSSEEDDVEKRQLVHAPRPPAEDRPPQQNRRRNHRGRHLRAASQSDAPVTATTKAVPAVVDVFTAANAGTGMLSQNNVTPERLPNITLSSGPREGQGSNSEVSEEELQLRLRLQTAGMRLLATAGGDKAVSAASCRIL